MTPTHTNAAFFVAGGTVPPDSPSYVERAADREFFQALLAAEFCYVLNSRQMGKSSLAVRTISKLIDAGVRTAFVDLTKLGGVTVTTEQWYAGLLMETGRALGLRAEAAVHLRASKDVGPSQRFLSFLQEVALAKIHGPVVLMIDEIDGVRSLGFPTDELFAGIRQLHNGRATEPDLKRLTVCLLGAALPSDLIGDPRTTPFNIGQRIELRDFTSQEARPFAAQIGEAALARVLYWTGGHPFLTQSLCAQLNREGDVDGLVRSSYLDARAFEADTNLTDVARRLLGEGDPRVGEKERADTLSLYERMLRGRDVADDEANSSSARIKMSGVARVQDGQLKPRNRIYGEAFNRRWVVKNMPGQERRRQRKAFWRGALRTGSVAVVIIFLIGWFALEARWQRDQARYEEYIASMSNLPSVRAQNDLTLLQKIVAAERDNPSRGWEWQYWSLAAHPELRTIPLDDDGYGPWQTTRDGRLAVLAHTFEPRVLFVPLDGIGKPRTFLLPGTKPLQIALCDDDRSLLISDGGNRLTAIDVRTGKQTWTKEFPGVSFEVRPGAVRDGRYLLGFTPRSCVEVDLRSRQSHLLGSLPVVERSRAAPSPDGKFVMWVQPHPAQLEWDLVIYDRSSWIETYRSEKFGYWERPTWSPKGARVLFMGRANGKSTFGVVAYNANTHAERVRELKGPISQIAISPDEKRLLIVRYDKTASIYDFDSTKDEPLATFPEASSALFLGAGDRILAKSWDLRIFDLSNALRPSLKSTWGETPRISADGRAWASNRTSTATLSLLDPHSPREEFPSQSRAPELSDTENTVWLRFSSDGKRLLVVDGVTGAVRLEVSAGSKDASRTPAQCTFDRSRDFVAFGRGGKSFDVYNMRTQQKVRSLDLAGEPKFARFSPDGALLAVGGGANEVVLVRTADWKILHRLRASWAAEPQDVAFSPDGAQVAVAQWNDRVTVFDLNSGILVGEPLTFSQQASAVTWSPDGSRIVTGGFAGLVRMWDAATHRPITDLRQSGRGIFALRFLDGGQILAAADEDGFVTLYRAKSSP